MSKRSFVVLAFAAMAWGFLIGRPVICPAAESGEKINLRVFYVGHPGSDREKDFVSFLEKYLTQVGTGDLAAFTEEQTRDFDVVILDYDGDPNKAPRPTIGPDYKRPTMTLGIMGGRLSSALKLKTAYG